MDEIILLVISYIYWSIISNDIEGTNGILFSIINAYLFDKLAEVPGVARGILEKKTFNLFSLWYPKGSLKTLANLVQPFGQAIANIYVYIGMSKELYYIDKRWIRTNKIFTKWKKVYRSQEIFRSSFKNFYYFYIRSC